MNHMVLKHDTNNKSRSNVNVRKTRKTYRLAKLATQLANQIANNNSQVRLLANNEASMMAAES